MSWNGQKKTIKVRDEGRTHAVSSKYFLYNFFFFFFALSKVFRDRDYLVKIFFSNETCMYPISEGNFLFSKAD